MYVLGIDTSTEVCSAAVANDNGIISEYYLNAGYTHAEKLPGAVDFVLSQAGISLTELSCISTTTGPGSFTGLRIGLAFAKGLSVGADIPLTAVSTFESIIYRIPVLSDELVVLIRSRKGEYYRAVFEPEMSNWKLTGDYHVVSEGDILKNINLDSKILITGIINYDLIENIKMKNKMEAVFLHSSYLRAYAASTAEIGVKKYKTGETVKPENLNPIYINKFLGIS